MNMSVTAPFVELVVHSSNMLTSSPDVCNERIARNGKNRKDGWITGYSSEMEGELSLGGVARVRKFSMTVWGFAE